MSRSRPIRFLAVPPAARAGRRVSLAIIAAILWGHGGTMAWGSESDLPFNGPVHLDDASLPDRVLTPGDAKERAKRRDLCDEDNNDGPSVPSSALCDNVFRRYDIPPERQFQYKCGFLVPPSIGGANTLTNVWPQPAPEATYKDALDIELHKQVCSADVEPMEAQREVAGDWVRTYRRYLVPGDPPPIVLETHAPPDTPARRVPMPNDDSPASTQASSSDLMPQVSPNMQPQQRQASAATAAATTNPANQTASSPGRQASTSTTTTAAANTSAGTSPVSHRTRSTMTRRHGSTSRVRRR